MNKLQQNDSLLNPTAVDLLYIIKVIGEENLPVTANEFASMSLAMGGIFWSDRKRTLISGVIGGAKKYSADEFQRRLRNTVPC